MKTLINRQALCGALSLLTSVVNVRTPKPALGCIKLVVANKRVVLSSTNMELFVQCTLTQVDNSGDGSALVPAKSFDAIVRSIEDDTVTIESSGDKTTIKSSRSSHGLLGFNPEEFPPLSIPDTKNSFTVPAKTLAKLIQKTDFVLENMGGRYAMDSLLIKNENGRLEAAAATNYMIAVCTDDACSLKSPLMVKLPKSSVSLISRSIADSDEDCSFLSDKTRAYLWIEKDGISIVSGLSQSEGTFPPYRDVMPKGYTKKASIGKDVFVSALRQASMLLTEEIKGVKFGFSSSELILSSAQADVGEASVRVPIQYDGEDLEIVLNADLLLSAVKTIDAETFTMELKSSTQPAMLTSGNDWTYVQSQINRA